MIIKQQTSNPLQLITINAEESIPAFRFINAMGKLCAHNEIPIGVSECSWGLGDTMSIISYGAVLIEVIDSVNKGDKISISNTSGKGCKKLNEAEWAGTALSSGTAGSIIKMKLVI